MAAALPMRNASLLLFVALLGLIRVDAWVAPKQKTCTLSNCKGLIKCPETCRDCFLSCRFCGMSFCPKCNKVGSVCQDPRFIGGDGVMFYFHGHKDADFCIMSDAGLHINAHFIGKRPIGRPRDFTWVQALAFLFDDHKLYIGAKTVKKWEAEADQFVIYYDGSAIAVPQGEGKTWFSAAKEVTLTRTENANSLNLEIIGLLNSTMSIVPVTKEESRVHKYEISDEDCFAHLEVNFDFLKLTDAVNGVLGQTYAPGFVNPVKRGVPMPMMGGDEKYQASSIFTPDCAVAQFKAMHHTSIMDSGRSSAGLDPFKARCGSDGADGSGFVCRR